MSSFLAALSPDDLDILFEPNPYSYDSTVRDPSKPPSPFVQSMREQEDLFFAVFPEAKKAAKYREHRKKQLLAFLAIRNANIFPVIRAYHGQGPYGSQPKYAPPQPHPAVTVPTSTTPLSHTHETHICKDDSELVPVTLTVYYQPQDARPDAYLPPQKRSLHRIKEEPQPEAKPQKPLSSYIPTPQPHIPTHHDHQPKDEHNPGSQSPHTNKDKPTRAIGYDHGADHVDRPSKPRPSTPKPSHTTHRPRSNKSTKAPGPKRHVGSLPGKRPRQRRQSLNGRKPTLACLFCRGRKIACGGPLPGSKSCNQCERRSLQCEFPAKSRRGMRRRKIFNDSDDGPDGQSSLPGESIPSP